MRSVDLIERHFRAGRLDQLLHGLSANGMDLTLALRIRLSQHPACALALALRRLTELAYGPSSLSRTMTSRLLDMQDSDGSFASDPLATACALAAFGQAHAQQQHLVDPEIGPACQRALAALAAMQADDGLISHPCDRTWQQRAMVSAFILHLLAHDAEFRGAIRLAEMMDWFEQHQDQLEPETEQDWLMARLDAGAGTPRGPLSPAYAAIAA